MQYNEHVYDWLAFLFHLDGEMAYKYKEFLKTKDYRDWSNQW